MKLIVGNFKMNLLIDDINNYLKELSNQDFFNVVYCPSYIYLSNFIDNNLVVGAQDVSSHENGAYTGEVSATQLKQLWVKYAIIGHSERRKYFNESDILLDKVKICLKEGIIPIFCIGETKEEYNNDETLSVLKNQLDLVLGKVNLDDVIIAYEPIWSIGTGLIPSNEEISKVIDYIKEYIYNNCKVNVKVLYGGSVNNQNIFELEKVNNIDGYLIGGCSVKADEFIKLVKFINKH